jgi:hypothetical protein
LRRDRGEHFRHAVDERLAADGADLRVVARGSDQMLAAAKADLKPNVGNWRRKEGSRFGNRRREIDGQPRQQLI